jgi:replication factor C subunit 1
VKRKRDQDFIMDVDDDDEDDFVVDDDDEDLIPKKKSKGKAPAKKRSTKEMNASTKSEDKIKTNANEGPKKFKYVFP